MKKIPSFQINHLLLHRGVYISRQDTFGQTTITTFDVRMKAPNREPVMDQGAMHTLEHLIATYLRNDSVWGKRIVYWGPMGCLTGSYLIVEGDWQPSDILPLLRNAFRFVMNFEGEIPGATAHDCGCYQLHNLPLARQEAKKYLTEVLTNPSPERLTYPKE